MTTHRPVALAAAALTLAAATPVQAEFYGLMNGRSVGRDALPDMSVEGGVVLGDLGEVDYRYIGARLNYRASPELMLYGDLGQTDVDIGDGADGIGFGVGGYYVVDGVFTTTDFAIKASYHTVGLEDDDGDEADFTALVLEAIVSGREGLGASGNIGWYANAGIHRLDFDDVGDDDTELGFGGGFVFPSEAGEFYVGLDIIDEMVFGGGFRYFLN